MFVRKLFKARSLPLLYAAVFLARIGFGAVIILFPLYLNVSSALLGIILGMYPALEAVTALPIGAYVDRRGRRKTFVTGLGCMGVMTFFIGLTQNVYLVGGAHGLMGVAAAMITISSLTMITDLTVVNNRGVGMGAFDMANLGGYGVGVIVGLVLDAAFPADLGLSFIVVASILGVATSFIHLALKEPPHQYLGRRSLKETFETLGRDVHTILPIWFSITIIVGFYLFLPKLVKDAGGHVADSAGVITLALVALGCGTLLFGRLSDKIGRVKTMFLGAGGELGFLLLFPDLFRRLITLKPGTPWDVSLGIVGPVGIIDGIFFFIGSALVPSILAYIGDRASRDLRGSAMGLYSLMLGVGIAVGNVLAGFAAEIGGVQAVFYLGAIIFSGLSATTAVLLRRENHLATSKDTARIRAPAGMPGALSNGETTK